METLLRSLIRDVPDFPKPGIVFKDITPLLGHPHIFPQLTRFWLERLASVDYDVIAGIESRGFIFGAALAQQRGIGFVPIRKAGKLPHDVIQEHYNLEYGTATIEVHSDAFTPGQRVLLVDDVLATGGTAAAAVSLLRRCGVAPAAFTCLVELDFLAGRRALPALPITTILHY